MKHHDGEPRPAPGPLRYAQCWEDADVLLEALDVQPGDVCLSIASAGDNSLALLTRNPSRVVALDRSEEQLHCLALRIAAYRHLEHAQLLELVGSRPSARRRSLFERCRPDLTAAAAGFWEQRWADVERWGIGGVGRFEAYLRLFRRWLLPCIHGSATVQALLRAGTAESRWRFYAQRWNTRRWRWLIRMFFSRSMMQRLGRDPAFFRYMDGDLAGHVEARIAHALQDLDPAENPYLHWILTGRHGEVLPLALRPQHFDTIRANLDRLELRCQSLEDFAGGGDRVDACNLSNVFEYMSAADHEYTYGRLLACTRPGARLAYWNMLVPREAPASLRGRIEPIAPGTSARLHAQARAFFYSRFVVEVVR